MSGALWKYSPRSQFYSSALSFGIYIVSDSIQALNWSDNAYMRDVHGIGVTLHRLDNTVNPLETAVFTPDTVLGRPIFHLYTTSNPLLKRN